MDEKTNKTGLSRQTYRKIKGYNREQMEKYLESIFAQGYEAGKKSLVKVDLKKTEEGKEDGEDKVGGLEGEA